MEVLVAAAAVAANAVTIAGGLAVLWRKLDVRLSALEAWAREVTVVLEAKLGVRFGNRLGAGDRSP